jgi:hypothetical protein
MASETNVRLLTSATPLDSSEGFKAMLTGVTVADLIQMKCMSGATECLRISSSGKVGVLQFSEGQLTHAATNDLLGESAVLELLNWKTGDCEPSAMALPHSSVIRRAWQSLLLASAQATDERFRTREAESPQPSAERAPVKPGDGGAGTVPSRPASVRLSCDGQVLTSVGASEDLAAAAAYTMHMANQIGEYLGLDLFRGCELRGGDLRTVLVMEANGDAFALQSDAEADVVEVRSRIGI